MNRVIKLLSLTCAVLLFAGAYSISQAQDTEPTYTVGDVIVEFIGVENVNEEVVRSNMEVKSGMEYNQHLVDRSLRSLYNTRLFEFIDVKRDGPDENGQVDLVFRVKPKYRVLAIYFDGNVELSDRRLQREISSTVNRALNERLIKEDAEKLYELYQKKGYTQVEVDYSIDRDPDTGFGEVTFSISEGEKVKISRVDFVGNENIRSKLLRKQMETRKSSMFSWLLGTGKFDDAKFEEDIEKLRTYYREEGYLDVEIMEDDIVFDFSREGRLRIEIPVDEGRQYRLGEVTITGNTLFPSERLLMSLKMQPGDVFNPTEVDEDETSLIDFYGSVGYLDTQVRVNRIPNIATGNIDLEYQITESERFQVESIIIEGNTKSKSIIILRELSLTPGMPFDLVRMKISKQRLENTKWFAEVDTRDEPTNIPGRRNLKVRVKEDRTGNLTFGAGFSSIQSVVGFIELYQGNFDLFNFRSFFQGDGQKMRLKLEVGSESNEMMLYFEEPYFLDNYFTQMGAGFQIYRQESDLDSNVYTIVRTGFEVFVRKRLFEMVEGRLSYRLENVAYDSYTNNLGDYLRQMTTFQDFTEEEARAEAEANKRPALDEEGNPIWVDENNQRTDEGVGKQVFRYDYGYERVVSRIQLQLLRDTRDKILFTTRGTRLDWKNTIAGGPLGGDADFYQSELRAAAYVPTVELLGSPQTFLVDFRTGISSGFGDTDVTPLSERFFLGGPGSLRGFEYREVGPVVGYQYDPESERYYDINVGEPLGGETFAALTLEYYFGITDEFRFSIFYDAGFVNKGTADFNLDGFCDDVGFGIEMMVMGTPLRLDYAIPITTTTIVNPGKPSESWTNDKGGQFNFSFGTRF